MPKYSEWILKNIVFYLELKLQKLGYDINLLSFEYDTSIKECHTLTITTDYSHNDILKNMQVNIAFPEKPSHDIVVESVKTKSTKTSPSVLKLIIKRDYNLAKLLDYTNAFICEYLNNTNYLNCLALPYTQPWKIFWPNKGTDHPYPILICETKSDLKCSNDDTAINKAQADIWIMLTHQQPPDMSRIFHFGKSRGALSKGNFPADDVILKIEAYSLQFLHEEYLALLNRRKAETVPKRLASSTPIVSPAAAVITNDNFALSFVGNATAVQPPSVKSSAIIPTLQIKLFYPFSSDEDAEDAAPKKSKKSRLEQKSFDQPGILDTTADTSFRKR